MARMRIAVPERAGSGGGRAAPAPLRVLLVEDSEDDALLLLRELGSDGREVRAERVTSAAALTEALERDAWDLVLSDFALPGFDGNASLRLVRERRPDLPFILVSGTIGEEVAVQSMLAGADDFVLKERLARLRPAVERALRVAHERRVHEATERENRERARLLERMAAVTPSFTYLREPESGRLALVTSGVQRLIGYAPEEVAGGGFAFLRALVHPEDGPGVDARLAAVALASDGIVETCCRVRRRDGQWIWLDLRETVFTCPSAEGPSQVLGIAFDVTSRLSAEEALRASEATTRALLQAIPDRLLRLRQDGALLPLSPRGERAPATAGWGAPFDPVGPAGAVGSAGAAGSAGPTTRLEQLLPAPIARGLLEQAHRALRSRRPATLQFSVAPDEGDPDGAAAPAAHLEARVVACASDEALVMLRDVTEARTLAARAQAADRLATVGMLAAGVAHEINNPMAYVNANLQFALDELRRLQPGAAAPLGEVLAALEGALHGSERVREIVRDLKMFSRADAAPEGAVDLRRVLEASIRMAMAEIRQRARLEVSFADLPEVVGSDARLGQVFLNLLVNAAQAIAPSHRGVEGQRVGVRTRLGAPGEVVVEVSDSGPGIPEEVRARMFEPFFTTKPVGEGTGLGLAICRDIVTGLGGRITVDTAVGQGTVFRVHLPVARRSPVARPAGPALLAVPARRKVLAIDDERIVLDALGRLLRRHHDVVAVERAEEALALLAAGQRFDCILSDLMMPQMSGMQLFRILQSAHPAQAARVVFITGGAFTLEAASFLRGVPNRRLDKPYALDALLAAIGEAASGRPEGATAAPVLAYGATFSTSQ